MVTAGRQTCNREHFTPRNQLRCLPHVLNGQQLPSLLGPRKPASILLLHCPVTCHPHFLLSPECVSPVPAPPPASSSTKVAPSPCLGFSCHAPQARMRYSLQVLQLLDSTLLTFLGSSLIKGFTVLSAEKQPWHPGATLILFRKFLY